MSQPGRAAHAASGTVLPLSLLPPPAVATATATAKMILARRPGFETMTPLPGIDHALQLFSIDLHKDT